MGHSLQTLHAIIHEPGRFLRAVFRLQTGDGRTVFMKVARTNGLNESRFVVEVDAARLLTLWKRDAFAPASVHGRERWTDDYKYERAEVGFSRGQQNPVGLAKVSVREIPVYVAAPTRARPRIVDLFTRRRRSEQHQPVAVAKKAVASLCDGNTRTLWLLANGVATFPVQCDDPGSAELLQSLAGVGSPILSIDQLLPLAAGD